MTYPVPRVDTVYICPLCQSPFRSRHACEDHIHGCWASKTDEMRSRIGTILISRDGDSSELLIPSEVGEDSVKGMLMYIEHGTDSIVIEWSSTCLSLANVAGFEPIDEPSARSETESWMDSLREIIDGFLGSARGDAQ